MNMKIIRTNDKRINLSLNPKQNNQNKNTSAKIKNMKCARPRYKLFVIMIKEENVNTKII
jgi:hypothetical protein